MPANERAAILLAILLILVSLPLVPLDAAPLSSAKRSKRDRDINAIGQREIVPEQIRKFVGSREKEKERGDVVAVQIQYSNKLIQDPSIASYIAGLAENLARNSDAPVPITVMLIDSDEVNACTAPGGYQYLTRGLLLQLESESELAAVLAHGIAHSALHTPTVQLLRRDLMQSFGGISPAKLAFMWLTCTSPAFSIFGGARAADEFDADYFGVQYLYKSGYDVDGYIRFVQRVWHAPPSANKTVVLALSQFPPVSQRSTALRHEIAEILPLRTETTVSTSAFENFEERLRLWHKLHPAPPAQRNRFCAGRIRTTENWRSPPAHARMRRIGGNAVSELRDIAEWVVMETQSEGNPESNQAKVEGHIRSAQQILKALQEKIGEHPEIGAAITKLEMALNDLAIQTGGLL